MQFITNRRIILLMRACESILNLVANCIVTYGATGKLELADFTFFVAGPNYIYMSVFQSCK